MLLDQTFIDRVSNQIERCVRVRGSKSGSAEAAYVHVDPPHSTLEVLLSSVLANTDLSTVINPDRFAEFLFDCWRPLSFPVTVLACTDAADQGIESVRFSTLIEHLAQSVMPFGVERALLLARASDACEGLRDPVDRPRVSYDAGLHARAVATPTPYGRMLAAIVRLWRVQRVVEIGTAYGMSSLFLASELKDTGRLITIEVSQPQRANSRRILSELEPDRISTIHAWSHEALGQVRAELGDIDLLFHDGGHSRESYRSDFALYEPLLASGALVLFDNIRWHNPIWATEDPETYKGWIEVTKHPRVRGAVEIGSDYGLLLLE